MPGGPSRDRAAALSLPASVASVYVRGASDRVPEALMGVGLPVALLTAEISSPETSPDSTPWSSEAAPTRPTRPPGTNARLLDYVRNGGLLMVQYQQYPFIEGVFAPSRSRSRGRTTASPTRRRSHDSRSRDPVFTTPNGSARRTGTAGSRNAASTSRAPGTRSTRRCSRWPIRAVRSRRAGFSPPARQGPLHLHRPRVLPTAPRGSAWRVSAVREPDRLEVMIKGGPSHEDEANRRRSTRRS